MVEADILRQRVKVRMENNPDTVSVFANEEVAVLRSGKAKKSDPPIPADLAPISGNGIRPRQPQKEEDSMVLEPIRFRYSTESVIEESEEKPAPEAPEKRIRRNDRRKPRGPRPDSGRPEQAGGPAMETASLTESPREEEKQPQPRPDRRPDRRRNKPNREPRQPSQEQNQPVGEMGEGKPEQKNRRRGNYRNYRKNRGTSQNSQGNSGE